MKFKVGHFVAAYGLCTALLLALVIYCANTCGKKHIENSLEKIESIKAAPVQHHQDKQGIDHATKQVAAADAETINALYNHLLDSVLKHVKTSQKNLQSVVAVSTETNDTVKPVISFVPVDTCISNYPDSLNYHDAWMDIKASIKTDSLIYHGRDSIIFTSYWKHIKFMKDELYLDAFSLNKNNTIKGITAVDLQQAKPHKLGLDVMAGYFWNGKSLSPGVGAGISYRITK